MKSGDPRYKYVRSIWSAGDLNSFDEIFNLVPRSVVATDLGLNYVRFSKKIMKPELLTLWDMYRLSNVTELDPKVLASLALDNVITMNEKKAKGGMK
jgi:hypothetical protein